tara:strand:+ start:61928 stop:62632 length:705 start_codon:yes stop_codon:yes gene_type:complete
MFNFLESQHLYLLLMIFSISFPIIRSFENKIKFYKKFNNLIVSILGMMLIFVPWDIIFTYNNIWMFNDKYTLGYKLLYLPIEEWIFFIFIPFSCVFIYEVLEYFFPIRRYDNFQIKVINLVIAFTLIFISIFYFQKTYTFICLISTGIFMIYLNKKNNSFLLSLYRLCFVSYFPFILINGILTGAFTTEPIVIYNEMENSNIRFFTIPIEDFIYNFLMLGTTLFIYHKKVSNHQ